MSHDTPAQSAAPAKVRHAIDYIELPAVNLAAAKAFYAAAFGWSFEDYGPDYASFLGAGIDGGIYRAEAPPPRGGAMVILYSDDLAASAEAIRAAGGEVLDTIEFPGGRRFHFVDPVGNALAVWTPT